MLGKKKFIILIGVNMAQYRVGSPKFIQHPCWKKNAIARQASVMMQRKAPKNKGGFWRVFWNSESQQIVKIRPWIKWPPWKGTRLNSSFPVMSFQIYFWNMCNSVGYICILSDFFTCKNILVFFIMLTITKSSHSSGHPQGLLGFHYRKRLIFLLKFMILYLVLFANQ